MSMKNIRMPMACLCLSGCLAGCIDPEAFRPSPPYYESWGKHGTTTLEIKKMLLECGESHPSGGRDQGLNEEALVHLCMVSSGYSPVGFKGRKEDPGGWCRNWSNLPACQPGAVIPEPSVERRLNSNYCRARLSYDECMVIVNDTDGIICPRRNYEKPPLECLP